MTQGKLCKNQVSSKSARVMLFCVDLTWNDNYDCKFFLDYLFVIGKRLCSQRFPARQWLAEYYHENITSQKFQAVLVCLATSWSSCCQTGELFKQLSCSESVQCEVKASQSKGKMSANLSLAVSSKFAICWWILLRNGHLMKKSLLHIWY